MGSTTVKIVKHVLIAFGVSAAAALAGMQAELPWRAVGIMAGQALLGALGISYTANKK